MIKENWIHEKPKSCAKFIKAQKEREKNLIRVKVDNCDHNTEIFIRPDDDPAQKIAEFWQKRANYQARQGWKRQAEEMREKITLIPIL